MIIVFMCKEGWGKQQRREISCDEPIFGWFSNKKTQIVSTFSLTTSSIEIAESNNSEFIHPNHNTIYGIENR